MLLLVDVAPFKYSPYQLGNTTRICVFTLFFGSSLWSSFVHACTELFHIISSDIVWKLFYCETPVSYCNMYYVYIGSPLCKLSLVLLLYFLFSILYIYTSTRSLQNGQFHHSYRTKSAQAHQKHPQENDSLWACWIIRITNLHYCIYMFR